jgi:hypothetical protein
MDYNNNLNFPDLMSDGRLFSHWETDATMNEQIIKSSNIKSNADYRKYLIDNADKIIKINQTQSCIQYSSCQLNGNKLNNNAPSIPYLYKTSLDNSQPFGYESSDLKESYLSQFQLQSRMVAPLLTQDELLQNGFPHSN